MRQVVHHLPLSQVVVIAEDELSLGDWEDDEVADDELLEDELEPPAVCPQTSDSRASRTRFANRRMIAIVQTTLIIGRLPLLEQRSQVITSLGSVIADVGDDMRSRRQSARSLSLALRLGMVSETHDALWRSQAEGS